MRLLLLLLNLLIIRWTQSEIANYTLVECKYKNESGMEMAELRFQGLPEGASCSLQMSVTATQSIEECLEDIETNDTSCLLNRTGVLPTITSIVTVNQTVKTTEFITTTSTHTQEVYSQTTVRICPMPTPSSTTISHLVTSTASTIYSTGSSDSTSTPTTKTVLSNVAQIGILAASGVLMCLPISALVVVTYCWIRTRRTLKERGGTGTNFVYSARDSINPPDISLDNNPAYEAQTPLQRNLAYEDTTLQSQSAGEPQSSSTQDPTYEIIPPAASGNTITAQTQRSGEDGDEYNRLNREPSNTRIQ